MGDCANFCENRLIFSLSAVNAAFTTKLSFLPLFPLRSVKTERFSAMLVQMNVKTRNDGAFTYRADDALNEKIVRASDLASRYLADANEAEEAGKREKAAKLYAKSQYWLDRYNKLIGNA